MKKHTLISACVLALGCQGRTIHVDNPVVGPPPPRVNVAQSEDSGERTARVEESDKSEGAIVRTEYQISRDDPLAEDWTEVAARVNGEPIFVSEILEPYAAQMAVAKKQLPASQFKKLRDQQIRKELPAYIDRTLLVGAVKQQMNAEQAASVEEQLDLIFDEFIHKKMKEAGVDTLAEFEAKLHAMGTSLGNLRRAMGNQQLASQYMGMHMPPSSPPTRQELLAYYKEHEDEFRLPDRVKWQQLWISYSRHGGQKQALKVLDEAIAALREGQSFDEIVRTYSDGPTKSQGGHWDWTQRESIADKDLQRTLFELKVNEISQVFAGKTAFQLVRVTDREFAHVQPFEDVQGRIRAAIQKKQQNQAADAVITKLRESAQIETMFDETAEPFTL